MYLTRLIYTSTTSSSFKSNDVENILSEARVHNKKSNVTGMLCFNSNYFLQCLEGCRNEVNMTYHKILNDKRHTNIVMLDYKEIDAREFDSWSMGYLPDSKLTKPINIKYSCSTAFNPYEMSGKSAHLMLLDLKDTIVSI
jgi:hypothetical protein